MQYGLHFHKFSSTSIQAFSDTVWVGSSDDRLSTGGYCIFLGDNFISWSYSKQHTIAWSSTGAEYKALANTAAKLSRILLLCSKIGLCFSKPPIL
jgi:hypothetical protein